MDLRVMERACAEQGGHCNDKLIGGVGNRVAAAGSSVRCERLRLPRLLLLGTYVPAGVHKQGSAIRVGIGGLILAARSGL